MDSAEQRTDALLACARAEYGTSLTEAEFARLRPHLQKIVQLSEEIRCIDVVECLDPPGWTQAAAT